MPGEGARLKDLAGRREPLDHRGGTADGSDRESAADDLPEGRQIRRDPELPLGALQPADPEAGDHLVEHEHRAVGLGQLPEGLEVTLDRVDDPVVAEDRLREHRRDLVAAVLEDRSDRRLVVERNSRGVRGEGLGDAGTRGRSVAGVALDERRLLGAVVPTLHDDDLVAAGVGPGQPDRGHRRLGAAVDESEHLDAGDVPADELRELDFDFGRCAVHRAGARVSLYRRLHGIGKIVAEQERAVPHHEIEIPVTVGVDDVRAVAALYKKRVGAGRPHGGVDPAGEHRERPVVQHPRPRVTVVGGVVVGHGRRLARRKKKLTRQRELGRSPDRRSAVRPPRCRARRSGCGARR